MILDRRETEGNQGEAGGQNYIRLYYHTYLQYKKNADKILTVFPSI